MTLLHIFIEEYLKIMGTLIENEPIENNRIVIDKSYFKDLLEKYRYLEFSQKTKAYKKMGFIIHDKNNYTLPCKDADLNKTVRKVVFDYETYLIYKYFYETELNI